MSAHSDLMRIPKTRGVEIRVSRSRYRNRERVDVREYVGFGEPDSMKPIKRCAPESPRTPACATHT